MHNEHKGAKREKCKCIDCLAPGKRQNKANKSICHKKEGCKMMVRQYDRVLLKSGNQASIVEVFEDGSFLADIDRDGDTYTEEIAKEEIQKIIS